MLNTPVVLIGFNRPDVTAQTFEKIRAARPAQLFLIFDGARPDRPGEEDLVARTREVVAVTDWPCEVHRRYAASNLGCEANVELGLDWVFSQVPEAIVLEDDCAPDATFFSYVDELVGRYRGDARVWHVAGHNHEVPEHYFGDDSYRFSTWGSVWGWATWADRWQQHRAEFPRTHDGAHDHEPRRATPATQAPGSLVTRAAEAHFRHAARSLDAVTHGWDKQWALTVISHGGLTATPRAPIVENIGFGAEATHGTNIRHQPPAIPIALPLRHPEVALCADVERELELALNRVGGRAVTLARRLVRSPRLRRALRGLVHGTVAVAISRFVARRTAPRALPTPTQSTTESRGPQ